MRYLRLSMRGVGLLLVVFLGLLTRAAWAVPIVYEMWYDADTDVSVVFNDPSSQSALYAWMRVGAWERVPVWVAPGVTWVVQGGGGGGAQPRPPGLPPPSAYRYRHHNPAPKGYVHVDWVNPAANVQWRPKGSKAPGGGPPSLPGAPPPLPWLPMTVCNNINVCFNVAWLAAAGPAPRAYRLSGCIIEGLYDSTADVDEYAMLEIFCTPGVGAEFGYPVDVYFRDQFLVGVMNGGVRIETDTDEFTGAYTPNLGTGCCIPEPGTLTLLGAAVAFLARGTWRRRKRAAR